MSRQNVSWGGHDPGSTRRTSPGRDLDRCLVSGQIEIALTEIDRPRDTLANWLTSYSGRASSEWRVKHAASRPVGLCRVRDGGDRRRACQRSVTVAERVDVRAAR